MGGKAMVINMKYKRQGQILKIIQEQNIKTHEQLIGELNKSGFNVTQATVSRDIKELGLVKIPLPDGGSIYSSSNDISGELDRRINMITDTVRSVEYAMNNVVVKTYPGMASAVAASVDASMRGDFLGSIAGDDTLLIITASEEKSAQISEKLMKLFR
ncbi:MAG: arginine repressor [Oscillospiraceae bacterium]|nr:arginine repressor [Oscillospiraceae bacterium]